MMKNRKPVRIASSPSTHRQPRVMPRNPPITGPRQGPINGAAVYMLIAIPRCAAGNMSAITPPALPKGELPKQPAKKRRTINVSMFWAPAAPALNAVNMANVAARVLRRPKTSLNGDQSRGPS